MLRFLFIGFSLLASTLLQPIVNADRSFSRGTEQFQFKGQSGQLGIKSGLNEINLKWKKIEEINPQNQRVNFINNFASQTFNWNIPVNSTYEGYPCTMVGLQSVLTTVSNPNKPIYFNITTYVLNTQVTIAYGNISLVVPKNTIKFTLDITNWPFASSVNKLRFGAEIKQDGPDGRNKSESEIKRYDINNDSRTVISDSTGFYDMPNIAIVDGQIRTIDVKQIRDDDNKLILLWSFPYFNHTLHYDPIMGTGTPSYLPIVTSSAYHSVITMELILILSLMVYVLQL